MVKRITCLTILIFSFFLVAEEVYADGHWKEEKGDHFIVLYDPSISMSWVRSVLRNAESYYDSIARKIGFSRYHDFWTWDNRVKIYIFENKTKFREYTGLPDWSRGAARQHFRTYKREIATFKQESGFLEGVLPHEIAHLILKDYIGLKNPLPLWFEEGVAQLLEKEKQRLVKPTMRVLIQREQNIPINNLFIYDIRKETDPMIVTTFYVQSLSIVNFLIEKYGNLKFGDLCSQLKSGKPLSNALIAVYSPYINSLKDLEKKWLSYMTN